MTTTDVRLFLESTAPEAEEVFAGQLDGCNRRIERHMTATRLHLGESQKSSRHRVSSSGRSGNYAVRCSRDSVLG